MRLLFLPLLLLAFLPSCSSYSLTTTNSSATVTLASGWQAKVVSDRSSIKMNHDDEHNRATFYTAGIKILVDGNRILIDGEEVASIPAGVDSVTYDRDDIHVTVHAAD
ncbi:MAG: hypothetical protein QM477_10345 [Planctomycetota bacterium]